MTTWASVFSTPFGPHWTFTDSGYARLAQGARAFPIFMTKSFNVDEVRCDIPRLTNMDWIILPKTAFKPVNLQFDTKFIKWHGQPIVEMAKLDDLMMVQFESPTEASLQGRTYIGFLLFLEELDT